MRKYFLDNVRYSIVLLVVFYHVFYLFNSVGVITSVDIAGVWQFDVVMYVLYPWFMVCLFLIAGVSARYALEKQGDRSFFRSRIKRILLPSVLLILVIGWISGWVTDQYVDMFGEVFGEVPGIVRYLIYCLCGIGPLWFLHQLMLATVLLLVLRRVDRKDRLWSLGEKTNAAALFLLVFAVWGSAQLFNTPLVEIYRNGIYCFMFLLGYYVFSHERVQALLEKWALVFGGMAVILCVAYTAFYWGENYASQENLKSFLTNAYAWFGTLAVLGCGRRYMNRETAFTRYMRGQQNGNAAAGGWDRSFLFYVLHYPLMVLIAYGLDRWVKPPAWLMYVLVIVCEAILLPAVTEAVRTIEGLIKRRNQ